MKEREEGETQSGEGWRVWALTTTRRNQLRDEKWPRAPWAVSLLVLGCLAGQLGWEIGAEWNWPRQYELQGTGGRALGAEAMTCGLSVEGMVYGWMSGGKMVGLLVAHEPALISGYSIHPVPHQHVHMLTCLTVMVMPK